MSLVDIKKMRLNIFLFFIIIKANKSLLRPQAYLGRLSKYQLVHFKIVYNYIIGKHTFSFNVILVIS